MNCFPGNLNLFHMWIKNRLQSRGLFKIVGSGYEKRGSPVISDTRNTAEIFRLCQRSLRLIVR